MFALFTFYFHFLYLLLTTDSSAGWGLWDSYIYIYIYVCVVTKCTCLFKLQLYQITRGNSSAISCRVPNLEIIKDDYNVVTVFIHMNI